MKVAAEEGGFSAVPKNRRKEDLLVAQKKDRCWLSRNGRSGGLLKAGGKKKGTEKGRGPQ